MVGQKAFCELHETATDDAEPVFAIRTESLPHSRLRRRRPADASRIWTAVTVGIVVMLVLVIMLIGAFNSGSSAIVPSESPRDVPVIADPLPGPGGSPAAQ